MLWYHNIYMRRTQAECTSRKIFASDCASMAKKHQVGTWNPIHNLSGTIKLGEGLALLGAFLRVFNGFELVDGHLRALVVRCHAIFIETFFE